MPTKTDIKSRIQQLNPAAFQILCDDYLGRIGYPDLVSFGTMAGAERTTKGTPDSYCISDGKYIFAEYTVQTTGLFAKIKDDIDKCFDESKTHVPVDHISEIVYCHTSSNLSPGDDRMLRGYCAEQGVLLTLIGIDKIADDIFWTYKTLSKEHLGLQIDTAQIQTADDFIKEYDSNAYAAPLDTCFLAREEKLRELADAFSKSNTVIVTGAAGVGKTRLSIEFARKHALENDEKLYCIHSRALGLNDDLCSYFEKPGKYFVIVDDANQITELCLVIDLVKAKREGFCFNLLLTVRDYATESVKRIIGAILQFDEIKLEIFKDDEIEDLVEKQYGIRNQLYLERIAAIAEGNARIAMMAGKIAAESNRLESIKDATGLYDEYYKSVLTGAELAADPTLLATAGLAAFMSPFHVDCIDALLPVLETAGVSKDIFLLSLKRLHELEIVDICNDKAVKFSDQCFANYLLKLVFCDKKVLSLKATIASTFFSFKGKTIEAINTLFRLFGESDISVYIIQEIMAVWTHLKETDPIRFWKFFKAFYPINRIEALCELKKKIENTGPIALSADQMDTDIEGNKRRHSENDEVITVLSGFAETEELDDAFDLFFQYYLKRPDLYYQFYHTTTNAFGINNNSLYYGYYTQIHFLTKLFEYSDNWSNDYILILFLDIAKEFLRFEFTPIEQTRDGKGVNWYRISLSYSDEVMVYRHLIWEQLEIIAKTGKQPERIKDIIRNYGRGISESSIKIIEEESPLINQIIMAGLSPDNLEDCLAVEDVASCFERNSINISGLQSFTNSQIMRIYRILTGPDYCREISREARQAKHTASVKEFIKSYTDPVDAFICLLSVYTSINHEGRYEYSAYVGINMALQELSSNKAAYLNAIRYILTVGNCNGIDLYAVLKTLFSMLSASDVFSLIYDTSTNEVSTNFWLYAFYHELPEECVDLGQLEGLYCFLKDSSDSMIKQSGSREIDFLKKYVSCDKGVFLRAARIILKKQDYSHFIVNIYFSRMFNPYVGDPLNYLQLFADDIDLLEDIYFTLLHNGSNMDNEGAFILKLAKADNTFSKRLAKELILEVKAHSLYDADTRYAAVYDLDNYIEVIDDVLKAAELFSANISWDLPKLIGIFILLPNGKTELIDKQNAWIHHYVTENVHDYLKIESLLDALPEGALERRKVITKWFTESNSDYNSFMALPILPRSYTIVGSSIPLYNNWIKYLESLLSIFHGIQFIEHRDYIIKQIEILRKKIRQEEIEDFITR